MYSSNASSRFSSHINVEKNRHSDLWHEFGGITKYAKAFFFGFHLCGSILSLSLFFLSSSHFLLCRLGLWLSDAAAAVRAAERLVLVAYIFNLSRYTVGHTHTHVPTPACVWAFCYSDVESNPKLLVFCSRHPLYKTCRVTLFQAAQSAVGEDLSLLKYHADFRRESWHIQSYILNSGMNDHSLWASSFECVSPWLHI